jgi:hypothetical protein
MAGRIAYLGNIATQGLVLNLDAAIKGSYPGAGTTWTDVSNNGNNGTLTNGPIFSLADYGSIVFDGVDDYVNMPLSVAQGQGDQTYSHWIKITASVSSDKNIFFEETAGTSNFTRIGSSLLSGSYFQFGGRGTSNEPSGNGYFRRSSSPIVLNLWTNVVGMWDVTNSTIRLYMNGSETNGSFSGAGSVQTHANTTPGTVRVGSSRNSEYFLGSISNIQVYNSILTPFQVWQNFNAYKSRYGIPDIVTDGLVLNLDAGNPYSYLSGSSGTTWSNVAPVSSSISGSLINGAFYSNGAITFDGVDDKVILPAGVTFSYGTGDFTLDGWFYVTKTLPQYGERIFTQTISGTNYFVFQVGSDEIVSTRNIEFVFATLGSGTRVSSSTTWEYNTWNYFTVSRINGTVIVYLNAVAGSAVSCTQDFNNTTYIPTIGQYTHTSTQSFGGRISNIRLYKGKGFTQAEITQNFNALRGRYGI